LPAEKAVKKDTGSIGARPLGFIRALSLLFVRLSGVEVTYAESLCGTSAPLSLTKIRENKCNSWQQPETNKNLKQNI